MKAGPKIEALIARSSIGAAIADIKTRGIDAHLEDLRPRRRPTQAPLTLDDGTPVGVGARVWRVQQHYARVTCAIVQPHWLTMWRDSMTGRVFATERAALAFAIDEATRRRAKARTSLRNEERAIARLKKRLHQQEPRT